MTVTPLAAPRPLPSVPCPVYDGHPVQWEPWTAQIRTTHIDPSCQACAFGGPLSTALGKVMPLPGDMFDSTEEGRLRSGRTYNRSVKVAAWPVFRLSATLCPTCFDLHVIARSGTGWTSAEGILCDGCDALCAIGATEAEARHTLTTLYDGWSAHGADWDLCRACNPAATASAPPRALAAFAASRVRSPK